MIDIKGHCSACTSYGNQPFYKVIEIKDYNPFAKKRLGVIKYLKKMKADLYKVPGIIIYI